MHSQKPFRNKISLFSLFLFLFSLSACTTVDELAFYGELERTSTHIWVVNQSHYNADDANMGTLQFPFKTITEAANRAEAGDVILVYGGTYRETIRPRHSGAKIQPFRFVTAPGEKVIVTGTEPLADWQMHKAEQIQTLASHQLDTDLYQTKVSWEVDQIFHNRQLMLPARYPNVSESLYKPQMLNITINEEGKGTLPSQNSLPPSLHDGIFWGMNKRAWVAVTSPIESIDAGARKTITFDGKPPFKGEGTFLIYNSLGALDVKNEWAQAGNTIFLFPPKKFDKNKVEATKRRWAFDLSNRKNIQIKGFHLFAASINMDEAENCIIENCSIRYPAFDHAMRGGFNRDRGINIHSEGLGIALGGSHNLIRHCVIAYSIGDGISIYGENNHVENCVIHDCNLAASDCAPINCTGRGHVITHCTLFNGGRSLIVHRKLKQGKIIHNHIFNAALMTNDLGATYCFQTDGQETEIAYNIVHDVHCHTGIGIYIDNFSPNHIIHHNLCFNNEDCGIRLNTPTSNIKVYHNTLTQNGRATAYWGANNNNEQPGVVFVNNIMTDPYELGEGAKAHNNYTKKNPKFKNPKKFDFRLTKNSPCIDEGVLLPGIPQQIKGEAPDLGCYEYGAENWECGSLIEPSQWMDQGW